MLDLDLGIQALVMVMRMREITLASNIALPDNVAFRNDELHVTIQ